jgi:hypothetical protein
MKRSTSKEVKLNYADDAHSSFRRRHFANADHGEDDGGFDVLPQPPERRSEAMRAREAAALVDGSGLDGINVRAGGSSNSKMTFRHVTGRGLNDAIGDDDKHALAYGDDSAAAYGTGDCDNGLTAVEDLPNATSSRRKIPALGPKPKREGAQDGHYVQRSKR